MDKYKYIYENPEDNGLKRVGLTRKEHNKLFPKRKIVLRQKCEYYYNDNMVLIHFFYSWLGKLVVILLVPISILYYGVGNVGETFKDLKRILNQKKYGAFTSDYVSGKSSIYEDFIRIIEEK